MNPSKRILPTAAELNERFAYCPVSGVFRWKVRCHQGGRVGGIAGYITPNGYRLIRVNNGQYQAHRLAWVMIHGSAPADQIDHINGRREDNRISNLRPATCSQNQMNCGKRSDNSSGYKGVSWHKRKKKWSVGIQVERKRIFLGDFTEISDAAAAYAAASRRYHGEFSRLRHIDSAL